MRSSKRWIGPLLVLAVFLAGGVLLPWFGGGERTAAASCMGCGDRKEPKAELAESAAVFAGKVVRVDGSQVEFDVAMLWKGPKADRLTVFNEGGACPFVFKPGEEYVVYAKGQESRLTVPECTRTVGVLQAYDEVRALGEPVYHPAGEAMSVREEDRNLSAWYIGLGAAVFLIMIYILATTLRRRRS